MASAISSAIGEHQHVALLALAAALALAPLALRQAWKRGISTAETKNCARTLKTERVYSPSASVLSALSKTSPPRQSKLAARGEFVRAATQREVPVSMALWIAYRTWVDDALGDRSDESFHWFACERTLGLPNPATQKTASSAGEAGDMFACLAQAGLLRDDPTSSAPHELSRDTGAEDGAEAEAELAAWMARILEDFDEAMAVRRAAADGNVARLTSLLGGGGSARRLDEQLPGQRLPPCGETALHLAASAGQAEAVAALLDMGADLHAPTFAGWRPLHFGAQSEAADECVALLLRRRADIHATTGPSKATALHVASTHGRVDAIKLLLLSGAEPEAKAEGQTEGQTALEMARRRLLDCPCRADVVWPNRKWGPVLALLEKVAPMTSRDRIGFARRSWELHVASVLQAAAEARGGAALGRFGVLLDCYAEHLDAKDHDGASALHAAALEGHVEALELLLRGPHARADVNALNNLDEGALHLTAREGHLEATRLLLAEGARPHAATRAGARPVDLARRQKNGECAAVVDLLERESWIQ